jgi:uncharacterized protein (DUF1684 family)
MFKYNYLIVTALFVLASCKVKPDLSASVNIDSVRFAFKQYCLEKDAEFKAASGSPLLPDDKEGFTHLNYFAYNGAWRFEGPLQVYKKPDSTTVLGSKEGDVRPALKYGYFDFTVEGKTYRLQVIRILPHRPGQGDYLFLGFRDLTNDEETYGGGRYIELQMKPDGRYVVDFNYAYNPYCAYNPRYSCAIPPAENSLPLRVPAGEKLFKKH